MKHDVTLHDATIAVEIEACLGVLFDVQARKRIATAWANGWILGDEAMRLLVDLDLIEPPEVADDV